jgi:hypothetical protein
MTLAVNLAQGASNNVTFRNRIINGAMVLDQRNAGASVTPTADNTYTLDRWIARLSAASKYSVQQVTDAPDGFINSLKVTSLSAYSLGASDYFQVGQYLEGLNVQDLMWGTSTAKTITVSFWVKSSLTGTFGGTIFGYQTGIPSYPFSYTVNSANTWEQKTLTITGPTSGTFNTTNSGCFVLLFSLGVGSTLSSTANTWNYSTLYRSVTGAVSVVGTSGATFYITGVQLEAGTTASPFEYRQYGTELQLCMRYYKKIGGTYAGQNGTGYVFIGSGIQRSTISAAFGLAFSPTMRATPSVSFDSNVICSDRTNFDTTLASLSSIAGDGNGMEFFAAFSACGAATRPMLLSTAASTTGYMDFSSEL